ncbi:MAG: DUF1934 domain-containing protein [Clostridia bacterium]|nr:DUF1934 domain-containing protein [Clostridia bacterium]MBQ1375798.1 DUF1934 domain-containing protein [Clostridia bacterium]MBQ1434675.1 DUF1934 domain-containing protein [Clostridia bacterium]MBQ4249065.1 DUF1934 domain-containing protein [Clostridia bacterium]
MKKDMIISIKGTQRFEHSFDKIELIVSGTMESRAGKYYIKYDESDETGFRDSTVMLEVGDDSVLMRRKGRTANTEMMFKSGEKHICHYDTGYGIMNMGVSTRRINNALSGDGGRLYIKYAIDIDNTHAGNNTFEITLKEAGGSNDKSDKIS